SAGLDQVDRSESLLAQSIGDGGVAGVGLGGCLALSACHVLEVRLDERSGVLVLVLLATDQVADQGDRVRTAGGRSRVDVEDEVAFAASLDQRGVLDELGCGVSRVRDVLAIDLDVNLSEVADLGGVGEADGPVAGGDGLYDTGGAL